MNFNFRLAYVTQKAPCFSFLLPYLGIGKDRWELHVGCFCDVLRKAARCDGSKPTEAFWKLICNDWIQMANRKVSAR